MDHIQLQKIPAINKSKKHKLLDNFFLYSMTVLTCSIFCSSPFWFPSLFSFIKFVLFVSLPKISSTLLSSKFIFIVGNLIIIILVGESKFFVSNTVPAACDVYYNEYINRKKGLQNSPTIHEEKKKNSRSKDASFEENASKTCEGVMKMEAKVCGEEQLAVAKKGREETIILPTEELNKRADNFIARVNRQRMQEARLLLY